MTIKLFKILITFKQKPTHLMFYMLNSKTQKNKNQNKILIYDPMLTNCMFSK